MKTDGLSRPAPLLLGEVGETLQKKAWFEIVSALRRDVPEVTGLIKVV
jgi:hypothetical protein